MRKFVCVAWFLLLGILLGVASLSVGAAESSLCSYAGEIGKVSQYNDRTESPLYRRNVLFFGDSLCNARGEREAGKLDAGYAGRIGVRYSMNFKNYGASGYSLSSAKSTIFSKLEDARWDNEVGSDVRTAYDLVVLQGGVNDAWVNAPLGEISDSFKMSSFIKSTFAGGLEATLCYAKQHFPEATICYIIMYRMPNAIYGGEPVEGVRNMDAYVELQKQILEKWEIPYLDLYNDTKFNEEIFKVDTKTYLTDGVHMNSTGYTVLSMYLIPWLESLPLPERVLEEEVESDTEPAESEIGTEAETEAESDAVPTDPPKNDAGDGQTPPEDGARLPVWLFAAVGGGVLVIGGGAVIAVRCIRKRKEKT